MASMRPDIQAEQMTCAGSVRRDGRLEYHSFRFEVFDLPDLDGAPEDAALAGEIMAVAVSGAGSAIQRIATDRAPDGLLTQPRLDELNADLQRMADRLADAVSILTKSAWWLSNRARLTEDHAYSVIIEAGDTNQGP